MALINCPECGKEISDKARWCVHCGYPMEPERDAMDDTLKLLSVRDMKRIFGSSTKVVNDLLKKPGFPKIEIGGEYYVPMDMFRKWVKRNAAISKD